MDFAIENNGETCHYICTNLIPLSSSPVFSHLVPFFLFFFSLLNLKVWCLSSTWSLLLGWLPCTKLLEPASSEVWTSSPVWLLLLDFLPQFLWIKFCSGSSLVSFPGWSLSNLLDVGYPCFLLPLPLATLPNHPSSFQDTDVAVFASASGYPSQGFWDMWLCTQ